MAEEFLLPDIGEGLTEATIVSWYVDVGDSVGLDEPLVEIETDKAVVDIPSPFAGTVLHHGAGPDESLEVGALLVVVGAEGEEWNPAEAGDEPDDTADEPEIDAAPVVGTLATPGAQRGRKPQALPAVRRLAQQLGIRLEDVEGTGPGGRITEDDVRGAADDRPRRRTRMSPLRRAISANLGKSWREIPHVTTFGNADADALLAHRDWLGKPPLEALLVARIVPVLSEMPELNSYVDGSDIVTPGFFNVGIAVDTPEGLMVAVIKDADQKDLAQLAGDVERLADGARQRTLEPGELRGQTFTISNIGAVGGGFGTPVVPFGTGAILSVGRADPKPVVRDDRVVVGREFPLSLSYDHRLIDGATGRRFIMRVIEELERPA